MTRPEQGRRSQIARRIIRTAYGIDPKSTLLQIIRYELIGHEVAVILERESDAEPSVRVRVAQRLPCGRVKQLRKASKRGLMGYRDVFEHLEMLYDQYGGRQAEKTGGDLARHSLSRTSTA